MVCVGNEFGMYPGAFWPEKAGTDYELTPLLKPLESLRRDFTVFSHLDHGLKGGHYAIHAFLTGVKAVEAKGMADGGISLDQRAAEFVGSQARFPSLAIGSEGGLSGGCQMSWTRSGTRIPPSPARASSSVCCSWTRRPANAEKPPIAWRSKDRSSMSCSATPGPLNRRLSKPDSRKLDEYLASVRDVEVEAGTGQEMAGHPQAQARHRAKSRRTRGWSATCRCSTT